MPRIMCNPTALRRERQELLDSIGMTWDELFCTHAFHDLTPRQWDVWLAVRRLDFLLEDE